LTDANGDVKFDFVGFGRTHTYVALVEPKVTCTTKEYTWRGCKKCKSGCSNCLNAKQCTSCYGGFYKSVYSCIKCSSSCA